METNIPQLRAEALTRLKREGSRPFDRTEGAYVGYVLVRAVNGHNPTDRREHPLLQAAEFEIDVLGMGKWEWLLAWLSPHHAAAVMPQAIADIALVLLGTNPVPREALDAFGVVQRRSV